MEKMIDDQCDALEQSKYLGEHAAFRNKLWNSTRCMSGEEFLLAVEERLLGNGIDQSSKCACAYPGCTVLWSDESARAENGARVASGSCCSVSCAEQMSAHVARLGSKKDASARFTGLYELAKRERDEKMMMNARNGAAVGNTGALPHAKKDGRPLYAAGTKKTPIMHAVVKERPIVASSPGQEKNEPVFDATAIDGYRLKNVKPVGQKQAKRVHFPPDDALEHTQEFHAHDPPAGVGDDVPVDSLDAETGPASPARFVFNVEDAKGPVEDDMKSIGDMFGTLNVVVPLEENEEGGLADAPESEDTSTARENRSVDAILVKTLRDGAKHFPHLAIPDKVLSQLEELDAELASDRDGDSGDTGDSDMDGYEDIDSDFFSTDEDEDAPIRCQKTFFTQLYTFFDYWVTDVSLGIVSGELGPGTNHPSTPIPQVPEVVTAIQRFISIGSTTLTTKLCVDSPTTSSGTPATSFNRQTVVDGIARLAGSFRLDAALPAFDSKQWVIVCLVMLKALGVNSYPEFQALTETPAGAARVGEILGDACFTSEELLAVVSLLLGEI